mgnify:CR=1 FL=1
MPRYFFRVFDDSQHIEDRNCVELIDLAEARRELGRLVRLCEAATAEPSDQVNGKAALSRWLFSTSA